MRNRIGVFIVSLFLLSACTEDSLYSKSYSFDKSEWSQDVKPSFEVEINDIEKEYTFTLLLRTTTDYKYSNLWIFMKTLTPDGIESRVPYEFRITNDDGSWIGTKTGTMVETAMTFPKRKMPQQGRYLFTIEQGITQNPIDEVMDLTLTVEEYSEEEN